MRYKPASINVITSLFLVIMLLPGCLKDKVARTFKVYTPVYKTAAEVRENIRSNASENISRPGKIYIRNNFIFLNEIDKGIHVIDNANPSAPKNLAFIDIPGNQDLAVKGNILYADLYTDLVAIDITDPLNVSVKKIVNNAFPERRYSNGTPVDRAKIITEWIVKDTTIYEDQARNGSWGCPNCMLANDVSAFALAGTQRSLIGTGGSMARFSIVKNSLYTVSNSTLNVYSIETPDNPVSGNKINLGWGIETIYPFKDKLFIGSNTGMFIYDITNESNPAKLGQFTHLTSCDPVIADDKYAYVTLRSGVTCARGVNQLDVLDISNVSSPSLVKTYPMTNPHGLSKEGNNLVICDGGDGLKIYDATEVKNLKLVNHIKGFETFDVIAQNNLAIVVAKDGLRQYDYSNTKEVKLLSHVNWAQ